MFFYVEPTAIRYNNQNVRISTFGHKQRLFIIQLRVLDPKLNFVTVTEKSRILSHI